MGERDVPQTLLSAAAVRDRAHELLAIGIAGGLRHWRVDIDQLPAAADYVAQVVRSQYPTLNVPFHARWRHFVVNGRGLWADLSARTTWRDAESKARAAFDLAIVSVLLDAGAGPDWRFTDHGTTLSRSEGLAIAGFRMFEAGAFSSNSADPLRADAEALSTLATDKLERGFQVSSNNALVGVEGRAALLRRLGRQAAARVDLFARKDTPRPGGLFDLLVGRAEQGRLPAAAILHALLEALGPVWENRPTLDGVPLGDCWPHPASPHPDGMVPFHKLSQWLSYSLVEPLQQAGIEVVDLDGLTGLPEYRNGGLLMDTGVLTLADPADADRAWTPADELVVGWRAMTVALLDQIAPLVRERLGQTEAAFPLARVLEGGTWAAGRRIAAERRPGAAPPLTILSDGTVF